MKKMVLFTLALGLFVSTMFLTTSCEDINDADDVQYFEQMEAQNPTKSVANKPRAKSKASLAKSKM